MGMLYRFACVWRAGVARLRDIFARTQSKAQLLRVQEDSLKIPAACTFQPRLVSHRSMSRYDDKARILCVSDDVVLHVGHRSHVQVKCSVHRIHLIYAPRKLLQWKHILIFQYPYVCTPIHIFLVVVELCAEQMPWLPLRWCAIELAPCCLGKWFLDFQAFVVIPMHASKWWVQTQLRVDISTFAWVDIQANRPSLTPLPCKLRRSSMFPS